MREFVNHCFNILYTITITHSSSQPPHRTRSSSVLTPCARPSPAPFRGLQRHARATLHRDGDGVDEVCIRRGVRQSRVTQAKHQHITYTRSSSTSQLVSSSATSLASHVRLTHDRIGRLPGLRTCHPLSPRQHYQCVDALYSQRYASQQMAPDAVIAPRPIHLSPSSPTACTSLKSTLSAHVGNCQKEEESLVAVCCVASDGCGTLRCSTLPGCAARVETTSIVTDLLVKLFPALRTALLNILAFYSAPVTRGLL